MAPLFLLGAVVAGWAIRSLDLESTALFIPGGLYGATAQAFGKRTSVAAAAALLVESSIFTALAGSVAGHMLAALVGFVPQALGSSRITVDDLSLTVAVVLIGG